MPLTMPHKICAALLLVVGASACADPRNVRLTPDIDLLPVEDSDAGPTLRFPDGGDGQDGSSPCGPGEADRLGRCYQLLDQPAGLTYAQARKACADQGSNVVAVSSAQENAVVMSLLGQPVGDLTHTSAAVWIGLRRAAAGSPAFVWNSGQPLTYVNWAPGEPSNHNSNEDCAVIWRPSLAGAGQWNDTPCDAPLRGAVVCAHAQ